MADVKTNTQHGTAAPQQYESATATPSVVETPIHAGIDYDLLEAFFFAYRAFVSDPDRLLADYHFGRAHHRVLHFVNRRNGLTIADLLDILGITKQSLNRVLKELVETGFVESRMGAHDRRQRHLYLTNAGHELAERLAKLQHERLQQAVQATGPGAREQAIRFLAAIHKDAVS